MAAHEGKNPHTSIKHLVYKKFGQQFGTSMPPNSAFKGSVYDLKSAIQHLWVQLTSKLESEYPGCMLALLELWSVREKNTIIITFSPDDRWSDILKMLLRCRSWGQKYAAFLIKGNKKCSLISMIFQLKIKHLKMMLLIANERSASTWDVHWVTGQISPWQRQFNYISSR